MGRVSFQSRHALSKGVKRYLQGSHPDRLLHAYQRDPASESGFRELAYDQAIALVASEIQRIQSTHGNDAFGVLTGASLTTEKAYLMGKFARMCLKTANIDYNGRLCMVSAGAANKKAFGIDRAANPGQTYSRLKSFGSAEQTLPNARRSPRTTCGKRESMARRSSWLTRASRQLPARVIYSCR